MKTTPIGNKVSHDKQNSNINNSKKIQTVQQKSSFAAKAQPGSSNDKKDAGDSFNEAILQELKQFSASKKGYFKHRI